jgi:hypothetical protein
MADRADRVEVVMRGQLRHGQRQRLRHPGRRRPTRGCLR